MAMNPLGASQLFNAESLKLFIVSLLIATLITDISKNKIPNKLLIIILITGFILQFYSEGIRGIGLSLIGIVVGFIIFMPFHLAGGMRGGDIKLMAACGAFLGINTPVAAGLSLIAGSVLGLAVLYFRHGLNDYLSRYYDMGINALYSGKFVYQAPDNGDVAAGSFPYAAAIVSGVLATLYLFS